MWGIQGAALFLSLLFDDQVDLLGGQVVFHRKGGSTHFTGLPENSLVAYLPFDRITTGNIELDTAKDI